MTAHGVEHIYSYQVGGEVKADRQAAVAIGDYMYSKCFSDQYVTIGGFPFTPTTEKNHVSAIVHLGDAEFNVMTGFRGDGNSYRLRQVKESEAADGCGFRLLQARVGDKQLSESYVKKMEEERRTAQQVSPASTPRAGWAELMMGAGLLAGYAALVLPWLGLLHSRRTAAIIAAALAGTCTLLVFLPAHEVLRGNVRFGLLGASVLILMSWGICIKLAVSAASEKKQFAGGVFDKSTAPIATKTPAGRIVRSIVVSIVAAIALYFALSVVISLIWR